MSLYEEPNPGHLHEQPPGELRASDPGVPVLILGVDIAQSEVLYLRPNGTPGTTALDYVTWDWRLNPDGAWRDMATPMPAPSELDGPGEDG